jgi:ribosome-associated protein
MLATTAREALLEKKAENVLILDVRGLSAVTDYYVVATGNNPPHLKALIDMLEEHLAQKGVVSFRVAGTPESEWIVADYVDAVVHIFSPAAREYYNLERLWADAPRVR